MVPMNLNNIPHFYTWRVLSTRMTLNILLNINWVLLIIRTLVNSISGEKNVGISMSIYTICNVLHIKLISLYLTL